jgi:hypothetical protein
LALEKHMPLRSSSGMHPALSGGGHQSAIDALTACVLFIIRGVT